MSGVQKLERAAILEFRKEYGEVTRLNKQGSKIKETDEFKYFSKKKLKNILKGWEK